MKWFFVVFGCFFHFFKLRLNSFGQEGPLPPFPAPSPSPSPGNRGSSPPLQGAGNRAFLAALFLWWWLCGLGSARPLNLWCGFGHLQVEGPWALGPVRSAGRGRSRHRDRTESIEGGTHAPLPPSLPSLPHHHPRPRGRLLPSPTRGRGGRGTVGPGWSERRYARRNLPLTSWAGDRGLWALDLKLKEPLCLQKLRTWWTAQQKRHTSGAVHTLAVVCTRHSYLYSSTSRVQAGET